MQLLQRFCSLELGLAHRLLAAVRPLMMVQVQVFEYCTENTMKHAASL
jgi:hypothetical protein